MENRSFQDEERANQIELELKESQSLAEEADRKYDEVKTEPICRGCVTPLNEIVAITHILHAEQIDFQSRCLL
jgi:hypothetical protein